jgi:hypothetical protein
VKLARTSHGHFYTCLKPWPIDSFVQAGDTGIVITHNHIGDVLTSLDKSAEAITAVLVPDTQPTENLPFYRTAFFEAFVNNPDTFIRGEGKTIEEAEQSAFTQFLAYKDCAGNHDLPNTPSEVLSRPHGPYEPRDYKNGSGYCVKCGLWFPHVIPPTHPCIHCGTLTWYSQDNQDDWWCETCYPLIPDDKLTEGQKEIRKMQAEFSGEPAESGESAISDEVKQEVIEFLEGDSEAPVKCSGCGDVITPPYGATIDFLGLRFYLCIPCARESDRQDDYQDAN